VKTSSQLANQKTLMSSLSCKRYLGVQHALALMGNCSAQSCQTPHDDDQEYIGCEGVSDGWCHVECVVISKKKFKEMSRPGYIILNRGIVMIVRRE
jgi:hypothetical protein